MSRDNGDAREGISRRGFVKGALAMGAVGAAVAGGALTLRSLVDNVPPEAQETFLYVNPAGARVPVWWVDRGLVGKRARLRHFRRGQGANVRWRWYIEDDKVVGGLSALLMRVDEELLEFPAGYVQDDFVIEGLYAVFNVCPHAGCRPGWKLVPPENQCHYPGFETIFCPCHYSQFHPTRMETYSHPEGATYLGVADIYRPTGRGMPLIPIEVGNEFIKGKLKEPAWYRYLGYGTTIPL